MDTVGLWVALDLFCMFFPLFISSPLPAPVSFCRHKLTGYKKIGGKMAEEHSVARCLIPVYVEAGELHNGQQCIIMSVWLLICSIVHRCTGCLVVSVSVWIILVFCRCFSPTLCLHCHCLCLVFCFLLSSHIICLYWTTPTYFQNLNN